MIIDKLESADQYTAMHPGLADAFKLLREFDFEAAEDGKHDIDGERLAIVVIRAPGKPQAEVELEAELAPGLPWCCRKDRLPSP